MLAFRNNDVALYRPSAGLRDSIGAVYGRAIPVGVIYVEDMYDPHDDCIVVRWLVSHGSDIQEMRLKDRRIDETNIDAVIAAMRMSV